MVHEICERRSLSPGGLGGKISYDTKCQFVRKFKISFKSDALEVQGLSVTT